MKVELLFTEIINHSKLYAEELVDQTCRFTGITQQIPITEYVGKNYCSVSVETIKGKIPAIIDSEYKGALDRIANEVFELKAEKSIYTLAFTIDTYGGNKARMLVKIIARYFDQEGNDIERTDEYDYILEKVKIEIKNLIITDWKSCVWIKDEQSEQLCSNLYPYIFRAENRLRAFANKLLIWELGPKWIESPGMEKYSESHKKLSEDFRSREPAFSNVDDVFISTTLETLFEIIQKGVVYESPFQLPQDQFNDLMNIINKSNSTSNVLNWIQKKRVIKKYLWDDIFKQHFSVTDNCQQIITDFIKNRNHVAHNKPITITAFEIMKNSFIDFDTMVKKANANFEESAPSEELNLTIDIQNEQAQEEEEQKEYEKNYLRDRIEGETGVEILWRDSIFELFIEKTENLYETFHDTYYWDSRFSISPINLIEDNEAWQTLFTVVCKADERYYLEIQASVSIDDEMDGDSSLNLRYIKYETEKANTEVDNSKTASINYHNGSGSENVFEGTVEVYSDSVLDETEMDDFIECLHSEIEELNPYISIKDSLEYSAVREGGPYPVAEFPCWECEKYGVSILDDFYPFGHCCYCGTDNEVKICERCRAPYSDGDGDKGLCNSCIEYIGKQ